MLYRGLDSLNSRSTLRNSISRHGASGQPASVSPLRSYFVSGATLLALAGWVAAHPLPRAPNLPCASQSRMADSGSMTTEVPADRRILVWADTRSGVFYFKSSPSYGRTPNGKYLEMKAAKKLGYRSVTGR